jgi:hypothetical protein
MIKPIVEIPKNQKEKWESYREKIRADIQEAIDRNINRFEFVGDYNFKTLAQMASEEARNIAWKIVRKWSNDNPQYKERYKFWIPGSWQVNKDLQLIKVSSVKGEKPGERRVFCEIKQDMDSIIRAYAERQIKEHEERRKNNDEY